MRLAWPVHFGRLGEIPTGQHGGARGVKFGAGMLIGIAIGIILVVWFVLRVIF